MSNKLTPWFNYIVKPVRKGIYERKFHGRQSHWSRWNGKHWCLFCGTREAAAKETMKSMYQNLPWRGLAEQPK